MNTIIRYLYRDASNYKVFNTCVIKGQLSVEQAGTIIDSLDMSEYFIPEQVGIPVTRFGSITEDDHPWCELDAEFYEMTEAEADVNITVDQLTSNFAAAKGKWDAEKYSVIPEY